MELKEFIPKVIFDIADGVQNAIENQDDHNTIINPQRICGSVGHLHIPSVQRQYKSVERMVQELELDIVFQVEQKKKCKTGIEGVVLNVISAGIGGGYSRSNTEQQHLHISIPICLPMTEFELEDERQ